MMFRTTKLLQKIHNAQQADLATLTREQQVEYAIARRAMAHAEAMGQAQQ